MTALRVRPMQEERLPPIALISKDSRTSPSLSRNLPLESSVQASVLCSWFTVASSAISRNAPNHNLCYTSDKMPAYHS